MCKNIILVIFLLLKLFNADENLSSELSSLKKKNVGFLFEMPKTLVEGTNETVCISMHGAKLPAKAIVDLKVKDKHYLSHTTLDADYKCFQINIPRLKNTNEPQFVSVRIQIQLNGNIYSAHNQDPILIYPNKKIVFIEADRSLYKPGDTVKIRILVLNNDLLPPINFKIPQVKIRNPLDITLAVWNNVIADLGLTQLEFQLPKESSLGKWKIETLNEIHTFDVNKYVLPRFGITITYPKIIYYETLNTTFKVCSHYSYGQYVKGNALIKLTDTHNNMNSFVQLKEMVNGCAEFIVSRGQLALYDLEKYALYDPRIQILITATVTEYGTSKIEVKTAKSLISLKPYTMKFDVDGIFLPGVPYEGKLRLSNINTDLKNEEIEICYNIAVKKSWNIVIDDQCKNFTVNDGSPINFHILPVKNSVIHIHLKARCTKHSAVADSSLVVRLYSPSNSYIKLEEKSQDSGSCKTTKLFNVIYTTDKLNDYENITFYYVIKSRGQINQMGKHVEYVRKRTPRYEQDFNDLIGEKHKYSKLNTSYNKFELKIKLDEKIIAKYQVLVYYITNNGETVVASQNMEIEPCLSNKVQASWSINEVRPGQGALLNIKTSSHSICSISSTDKSTSFFNKNQLFNLQLLLKSIGSDREVSPSNRKTCVTPTKKNAQLASLTMQDSMWDLKRRKRQVHSFSEDLDAYDTFNKFGFIIITNFKIVTKPCYSGPIVNESVKQVQSLTNYYEDQNEEREITKRSYFPETWLWQLLPIKGEEPVQIRREAPHAITNWVTNVYCISPTQGIGFSKTIELTTFQPFFIDVLTPYSIKRGEHLYLDVLIFNYLNYSIPIKITLAESMGMRLVDETSNKSASYCLQSLETVTHLYILKAETVGEMNITVVAEVDSMFAGRCGPDTVINKRDVVLKSVIIEPQGYPMKITKSALLCSGESSTANNISWNLIVPKDVIPYTAKAVLTLNGDLLGQIIENLEQLVAMPTGCGEQIMAKMAPNLYVLKYLTATNKLTTSLKQRAIRNIKIGYQAILNYAHKDGSFSAFGYHDPSGSMFLTTFVVRTLQDAKSYIFVDQKIIDNAVEWIFKHQLENGCFNTMLHVFQDMGETSLENSTSSLTSYVIISLMEANIQIPEPVKTNAKYCIRSHNNPDKYTLAISTYALFKVEWYSEADRALKRLMQVAQRQNDMLWWSSKESHGSLATDIEITSYVLLSLLHYNSTENLANAYSIVRWLSSKRGPQGGFKSTQDTVVALDALSKFASMIHARQLNIKIDINAHRQRLQVQMNEKDRLKSKKIDLIEPNNNIGIFVTGDGCILSQVVLSYNINNIPHSEAFKLAVDISPVSTTDVCSIASLSPCLAYTGPDFQSNMAILEVNLPSGYQADRASLHNLVDLESNTRVKMFEEINDKVLLYFTKVTKELICVTFNINEHIIVDDRQAATIKIFDYYKPEYEVIKYYRISKKCEYNETSTLPEISAKTIKQKQEIHHIKNTIDDNFTTTDYGVEKNVIRKRRDGMNKDFVNMDVDMEVPNGMESNQPTYVNPPRNKSITTNSRKIRNMFSTEERVKRKKRQINFVNKDVNMETPKCENVEYHVTAPPKSIQTSSKPLNSKTKRYAYLKNANGMVSNQPTYVNPPKNKSITTNIRKIRNMFSTEERIKRRKRQINFVNKDVNMETPKCENVEYHVTAPPKSIQTSSKPLSAKTKRYAHLKNANGASLSIIPNKNQNSKRKREVLNSNFIDMNIDMETPNGMEGPMPVYSLPKRNNTSASAKNKN